MWFVVRWYPVSRVFWVVARWLLTDPSQKTTLKSLTFLSLDKTQVPKLYPVLALENIYMKYLNWFKQSNLN